MKAELATSTAVGLVLGLLLAACTPHAESDEQEPWPAEVLPTAPRPSTTPAPQPPPPEPFACPRRGGRLEVPCNPKPVERLGARLRSHTDGCLGVNCQRVWGGIPVPTFVALTIGTEELTILDESDDGYLALYRDPYGASSCHLSDAANCEFHVRFYDRGGAIVGQLRLNDFMSRSDHLEVQDVRYDGGVVYFNEACQSYSREVGGRCSALIGVDLRSGERLFRTKNLVSNGEFVVLDEHVVVSYGFTSERPSLSLVDKRSGKVTWTTKPPYSAQTMRKIDGTTVLTHDYRDRPTTYVVRNGALVRGSMPRE